MSDEERRDRLFKDLLKKDKDAKAESSASGEDPGAIVLKPDTALQAPTLNAASLLAQTGKLGFIASWRLGHEYSEAQRTQLKEVLATQNRLVLDKLAVLESQSKTHRMQTIALMVEFTVAQAEKELTSIRAQRHNQRNKQINDMTLRYVDDVHEVENNPKLPEELRDIRLEELTSDFRKAVDEVRSGAILKQHGLE
jgi:hypothetical protein